MGKGATESGSLAGFAPAVLVPRSDKDAMRGSRSESSQEQSDMVSVSEKQMVITWLRMVTSRGSKTDAAQRERVPSSSWTGDRDMARLADGSAG